jgi:hypothetical protein
MTTQEFTIPDKLRQWKIERIAQIGPVLRIEYDGIAIVVEFDIKKLTASMKRFRKEAERRITSNGAAASEIINELELHITKEVLDHYEQSLANNNDNGGNDKIITLVGGGGSSSSSKTAPELTREISPKIARANCTFDQWSSNLQTKYEALKAVTNEKIPGLWTPLEFAISLRSIMHIDKITLPFIGIILGPASSHKSVAVDINEGARHTFSTDNFSARAFVSHNSGVPDDELAKIDLLPKVVNKEFLVPELSPLFTSKEEDLNNAIGIITRIADGKGYVSDTGAKGHRGYRGQVMFVWLAAAVDIPYKVHKILSTLGPKLYFLRLQASSKSEDSLLQSMEQDDWKERLRDVAAVLFDYYEYLESCPAMRPDPDLDEIPRLSWNQQQQKDVEQTTAQRYIIRLAKLLAHLRGTVATWETEDTQGLDYAFSTPYIEDPSRAVIQLYNLARGHALSQGRDYITVEDDLPLVTKVVLSGAASIDRVKILNALLERKKRDYVNVNDLVTITETSEKTAKKTMAELKALKLVDIAELGPNGRALLQIRLRDGFEWFMGEEFRALKGDYVPGDFTDLIIGTGGRKGRPRRGRHTKSDPHVEKKIFSEASEEDEQEDSNNNDEDDDGSGEEW